MNKTVKIVLLAVGLLLVCALALMAFRPNGGNDNARTTATTTAQTVTTTADTTAPSSGEQSTTAPQMTSADPCATGHSYDQTVLPPTRTEQGYTSYTCSVCGHSCVGSYVPATGSLGLAYEVNADGKTCTVTGIGECADTEIMIGEQIDGYTVTVIGERAFDGCVGITDVIIPESVTSIGSGAFWDCSGLTSITVPGSVKSIGFRAFTVCTGLESVTLCDGVTSIDESAFMGCIALKSITIPNSVKDIGDSAFRGCRSLTEVTVPEGLTGIDDMTFRECSALKSITLPRSVTSIGGYAFEACDALEKVCYTGSAEDWAKISIGDGNPSLESKLVFVTP